MIEEFVYNDPQRLEGKRTQEHTIYESLKLMEISFESESSYSHLYPTNTSFREYWIGS